MGERGGMDWMGAGRNDLTFAGGGGVRRRGATLYPNIYNTGKV